MFKQNHLIPKRYNMMYLWNLTVWKGGTSLLNPLIHLESHRNSWGTPNQPWQQIMKPAILGHVPVFADVQAYQLQMEVSKSWVTSNHPSHDHDSVTTQSWKPWWRLVTTGDPAYILSTPQITRKITTAGRCRHFSQVAPLIILASTCMSRSAASKGSIGGKSPDKKWVVSNMWKPPWYLGWNHENHRVSIFHRYL